MAIHLLVHMGAIWVKKPYDVVTQLFLSLTVQLSYKVTSGCVSLMSFTLVTHKYHTCCSQVSCVPLASILHVAKLRVCSTAVYFYSSFSLQVTSKLKVSMQYVIVCFWIQFFTAIGYDHRQVSHRPISHWTKPAYFYYQIKLDN